MLIIQQTMPDILRNFFRGISLKNIFCMRHFYMIDCRSNLTILTVDIDDRNCTIFKLVYSKNQQLDDRKDFAKSYFFRNENWPLSSGDRPSGEISRLHSAIDRVISCVSCMIAAHIVHCLSRSSSILLLIITQKLI